MEAPCAVCGRETARLMARYVERLTVENLFGAGALSVRGLCGGDSVAPAPTMRHLMTSPRARAGGSAASIAASSTGTTPGKRGAP